MGVTANVVVMVVVTITTVLSREKKIAVRALVMIYKPILCNRAVGKKKPNCY